MANENWGILSSADEDALHNVSRLLSVEVRSFTRLANHLTKSTTAFDSVRQTHLPSPPPDASAADEEAATRATRQRRQAEKVEAWRSEVLTELRLMEYTVLRAELITESNKEERERYAKEAVAVTQKQEHVRSTIEKLRVDLENAKETLAVRKSYDELAEKITSSKMLKPRLEQEVAHRKLDDEIAELRKQVEDAKNTWEERRQQFQRIDSETQRMANMIKAEKEEAERQEGMMKDGDEDGDGDTTRAISVVGTPRPDGGLTPIHTSQTTDSQGALKVPQDRLAPLSRATSAAPSPARSGLGEDVEMVGSEDAKDANADDSSGLEEGEDLEEGEHDGDGGDGSEGEMEER